jgi:3-hydroxyisobutyrate dehydrogenase-like beta-hydroxyacid dehydrogenase
MEHGTPVGFAGLGNLGQPMALALLRQGWPVTGYDPRPERVAPCVEAGGRAAGGPAELAGCGLVALAVPDDVAVTEVLEDRGLLDALPSGAVVVLHSTVLPATAQRLAALAAERGLGVLDAPVSGGADRAREGRLTVMVGGEKSTVDSTLPYLESIGEHVVHVGPAGAGAAAKLGNQLMMFAALAGAHEAIALAERYGVARADLLAVARTGTGDSWAAREWGFFDRVVADYDATAVPLRYRPWSKDLWDVVAAARTAQLPVPLAALLSQTLADVVERHAHR